MAVNYKLVIKEHQERQDSKDLEGFLTGPWKEGSEQVVQVEILDGDLVTQIEQAVDELDLTELLGSYHTAEGRRRIRPCELLEPPDGDVYYTERLVRLPNLGVYSARGQE